MQFWSELTHSDYSYKATESLQPPAAVGQTDLLDASACHHVHTQGGLTETASFSSYYLLTLPLFLICKARSCSYSPRVNVGDHLQVSTSPSPPQPSSWGSLTRTIFSGASKLLRCAALLQDRQKPTKEKGMILYWHKPITEIPLKNHLSRMLRKHSTVCFGKTEKVSALSGLASTWLIA